MSVFPATVEVQLLQMVPSKAPPPLPYLDLAHSPAFCCHNLPCSRCVCVDLSPLGTILYQCGFFLAMHPIHVCSFPPCALLFGPASALYSLRPCTLSSLV